MAMRLKVVSQSLRLDNMMDEVSLVAACDSEAEIDPFLQSLAKSEVKRLVVWTDFLSSLAEDKILEFWRVMGMMINLEELIIKSSSRFHVEIIPQHGLLSIRNASRLRKVVFEDMQVTALQQSFIAILGKALENHPSLEEVVMSNFFSNDWANTEPNTLDPLVSALATIPNLKLLTLTGCGGYALDFQKVQLISTSALSRLFRHSELRDLQLSFLELDDMQFEAIASELPSNTSITQLALDYHNLSDPGFDHMMAAMANNDVIKTLSLRSLWNIGDAGFQKAMSMLRRNYSIEVLSVTASPPQQAEINLYTRMNGAGRGLLRDPSTSMSQWVDVLLQNNEDLDVVRHLLKEIPGLFIAATA
eukprot:scaffold584_cov132-Cylindrotheca_fusiformis.AAC.8